MGQHLKIGIFLKIKKHVSNLHHICVKWASYLSHFFYNGIFRKKTSIVCISRPEHPMAQRSKSKLVFILVFQNVDEGKSLNVWRTLDHIEIQIEHLLLILFSISNIKIDQINLTWQWRRWSKASSSSWISSRRLLQHFWDLELGNSNF